MVERSSKRVKELVPEKVRVALGSFFVLIGLLATFIVMLMAISLIAHAIAS